MATTVATLKTVFTADTADFDKGKRRVEGGLTSLGGQISGLGDTLSGVGRSMLTFAAPLTAALGGAVYAAMDFDEQLRNIQAVTGQSAGEIDALGQSILDMNTRFTSTELATTFYDIAGGVTDASQHMDVFNAAIHTAQAGNADLQATTQALIGTMNAYAASGLTATEASDILTRTVGMGVGTMNDFAAALPNVTGLAASVGISFDELAAATAYLTTKGNTASEATTQLSAVISALLTPNAQMAEAFRNAGIESGSLALSSEGLMGTLNLLKDSFGGNIDEMAKAFGSVEALRAVVSLAGGDVDEFFSTFTEGVAGATAAAEDVQLTSAAAQFDILKSSLQDVAIQIGLALLPSLNKIGRAILPVVTKFATWAKENPKLVTAIAAVVLGVTGLGIAFTVLGSILGVVGTVFAVVLSPIGLAVLAIGALAAAIYVLSGGTLPGLIDVLKEAAQWIGQFGSGLMNAFKEGGLEGAGQFIQDKLITPIINAVMNADWSAIGEQTWAGVKRALLAVMASTWDASQWMRINVFTPIYNAAMNLDWSMVAGTTWTLIKMQFAALGTGWEGAQAWLSDHVFNPLWESVKTADWGQIAKDAAQGIWDGLVTQVEGIIDMNKWVIDNIIDPVKEALGISSPSTIFYEVGVSVVEGLANGLRAMIGLVASAALAILSAASGPLNSLISLAASALSAVTNATGNVVSSAVGSPIGGPGQRVVPIPAGLQLPQGAAAQPDGRASGGPVAAGAPYMVGEEGPELFVPRTSGSIMSNGSLPSMTFNGDIYVNGVQNPQQFLDQLRNLAQNKQGARGMVRTG